MTSPLAELKTLLLEDPKWSVSVAESLTSGRVQALLGSISGASNFFAGGLTAYSLDQKVKFLGVDRESAAPVDSVSENVARQMAVGAARAFNTTWAVSTTGYAEAFPERNVSEPFACWAVAQKQEDGFVLSSGRVTCAGLARIAVQERVAETVIGELLARVREARGR